ncbi:hypothetical protein [Rhizobium leguminosarum]|uniref:hypothetical protein n=1 Tax=Rhizobium leguminosarum TaxID=384 RepID=UPI0015D99045|nr:hypothetical protein [Rhizobium leguminosarum]NZD50503.1 hypothetical protein [Rhizobium leguminosarum]
MPKKPQPEYGIGFTGWRDPPLTGTPLDYVPIDAPVGKPGKPTIFRAPAIKRAAIAAAAFGGAVAALILFPVAVIALVVMAGAVWGADKLAARLNAYDE